MSSLIPVSRLTSSDLSRLGNNLPRRKHRSLSELWHTEAVRRSLEIFERDLIEDDADLYNGQPERAGIAAA